MPDSTESILISAGVVDARQRLHDDPAISGIVDVSRTLRDVELGEIPPAAVFRAGGQ